MGKVKKSQAITNWIRLNRFRRKSPDLRHVLGLRGEAIACQELKRRGYTILERRVRGKLGEIDIVARDGPDLVFIEVKTRSGTRFGTPAEAVDRRKQKKLVTLAHAYLARKRKKEVPVRFDIVSVLEIPGRKPQVEVFQGAFVET
jgi:putative endonuclease